MIRLLFRKISRAVLGGRRAEIRDLHHPTGVGIEFPEGISPDAASIVAASMLSLTGDPLLRRFADGMMNYQMAKLGTELGAKMASERAAKAVEPKKDEG